MIEELQRRNFAESTIRSYVHGVEHFSQYFHLRPDRLGPQHIRQYQAMLFSRLKYSPNTVISRLAALRFFYIKVLKRNWSIAETPYPRKVIRLPEILSPEEVTRLIDAADSTFHRAMLMTLYATGARRADQKLFEQVLDFAGILLDKAQINVHVVYILQQHAAFDAASNGAPFVLGKVVSRVGIKQFNNSRFKLVEALLEYRAEIKANRGWMEVLKAIAVAINVTDRTVRNLISEYEQVSAILPTAVIQETDSRGIDLCQKRYLPAVKTHEGTIKPDDVVNEKQAGQIVDSIIAFKSADKVANSPKSVPSIEDFANRTAVSFEKLLNGVSPEVREAKVRYVLEYINARLRAPIRELRQYGRPTLVPKPATRKEEIA
jgi:hypothetical protein